MLYRKFKEWNIQRRKRIETPERCNAKYNIDYNFFDLIDNEKKAYWLGFLIADGYVNEKEISLCVQRNDIEVINKFKESLNAEQPILFNKDDNPVITIVCKKLCDELRKYGLHNRKSWDLDINKAISQVPIELENHFIRGLFDGDGSVKIYKYNYLNKPQYHFGYTGLKNVCEYIKNKFGINRELVFEGNVTYSCVTRDINIINKIYEYLYKDATLYLSRKKITFNEIQMMTFNDYNKAIS